MADDSVLIQGSETIQVAWIIRYEYLFCESDGLILGKNGALPQFYKGNSSPNIVKTESFYSPHSL